MRWKQSAALVVAAGALCGCTTIENEMWGLRYGPSPALVAADVQVSVARQSAVVAAVAAGLDPRTLNAGPLPPAAARDAWYSLILSGFNTIDDACMSYVDSLWIMERQKHRNSTILAAAGAAGAALLGAAQPTPSVAAGLVVLAQAFGFAGILNNAIFDTYLYSQNAATIKKLLRKTTAAYRQDFADKTRATLDEVVYPVASPGAAYHHMREYLALCLPPTIQAQIEVLVGGAQAIPDDMLEKINGKGAPIPPPAARSLAPSAAVRSTGTRISPVTSVVVTGTR